MIRRYGYEMNDCNGGDSAYSVNEQANFSLGQFLPNE